MTNNPVARAGHIVVIGGCMFAGKTGRLIERLTAARDEGVAVLAFKHRLDDRYAPTQLASHDGRTFPATVAATAAEIDAQAGRAVMVGIDEAQFFGRALIAVVQRLAGRGCTVIAVGIEFDTWGQPFPPLAELQAIADEVEILRAPCGVCGAPAPFSQRMVPVIAGRLIGGPAEYQPRCAAHFMPLPPPAPVYE